MRDTHHSSLLGASCLPGLPRVRAKGGQKASVVESVPLRLNLMDGAIAAASKAIPITMAMGDQFSRVKSSLNAKTTSAVRAVPPSNRNK